MPKSVRSLAVLIVVFLLGAGSFALVSHEERARPVSAIKFSGGNVAGDGSSGRFVVWNVGANPVSLSNITVYPGISGCSWKLAILEGKMNALSNSYNSSAAMQPGETESIWFGNSCLGFVPGNAYVITVNGFDSSNNSVYTYCAVVLAKISNSEGASFC